MNTRLVLAIISILIEEAALAAIALVGLPQAGIKMHIAVLVAIMLGWLVIAVLVYRAGSRALKKKPQTGMATMVGSRGKVVRSLQPEGLVRVGGELWRAQATGRQPQIGEEVIVVEQQGGKLLVRVMGE
jgi:membrane protein implicated in regulation of membrane protease activity